MNFLFYIFSHVFLGAENIFIKNGNFQAFFLKEAYFLFPVHYFDLPFVS